MTTNDTHKSQTLRISAIVVILGQMYWLDTVTILWRRQAHATFKMQSFNLFSLTLPVFFAVLAIFLSWLLLVRFKPTWVTLVFCLLIGAGYVILAISIVFANPFMLQILNSTGLAYISRVILELGSSSMTLQVGAFILVIGLINLIRILVTATPRSL
jgi:hypothetical protein